MRRLGKQLGALALLALLVRAIVPAGYMVAGAETPSGRYLTITFCGERHTPPRVIDLDTGAVVDAGKLPAGPANGTPSGHQPCVFAATAHFATPSATTEAVLFTTAHAATFVPALAVYIGQGIAAPPPPSTGPPSLI